MGWVIALILNLAIVGDLDQLVIHILLGIALIVYMPAAMCLVAKGSKSSFTHAGGEVAYTVIQWILWGGESRCVAFSQTTSVARFDTSVASLEIGYFVS